MMNTLGVIRSAVALVLFFSQAPGLSAQLRVGLDLLPPVDDSRSLWTTNANVYFAVGELERPRLRFLAGATATWARGDITQLEGSLEEGTLRDVEYESSALGIGPSFLVQWSLLSRGRITLDVSGSGSVLLYSERFPAGGERYNFMWRGGPGVTFDLGAHRTLGVGFHWMHVSNGQGLGPQNPSYDARGLNLRFTVS